MVSTFGNIFVLFFATSSRVANGQQVFAVTTETQCAESLPFGHCDDELTANSTAMVCTNFKDVVHEFFTQTFYVNDIHQFTVEWAFQSGPKTLQQRFENAVAAGEEVIWSVTAAPGLEFGPDGDKVIAETHHGVWRFSSSANVDSAFVQLQGSGFSGDDGSWGAAFTDGVTELNGDDGGNLRGGWGHENQNAKPGDGQCKYWYANGVRGECGSGDTIRNVMSFGISGGTCFRGSTLVTLEDNSTKPISEVEIGDRIQTSDESGKLAFAPIVHLPHERGNKEKATFLKLTTDFGKSVEMTPGHLLPICDERIVAAADLHVGDCLLTVDGKETLVNIASSSHHGVYSAFTAHAFIVADGIIASPFSNENDPGRSLKTGDSFMRDLAAKWGISSLTHH